jgi:hypothetical protein
MRPSAGITRAGLTLKTFIPSSSRRKPNLPGENRSLRRRGTGRPSHKAAHIGHGTFGYTRVLSMSAGHDKLCRAKGVSHQAVSRRRCLAPKLSRTKPSRTKKGAASLWCASVDPSAVSARSRLGPDLRHRPAPLLSSAQLTGLRGERAWIPAVGRGPAAACVRWNRSAHALRPWPATPDVPCRPSVRVLTRGISWAPGYRFGLVAFPTGASPA